MSTIWFNTEEKLFDDSNLDAGVEDYLRMDSEKTPDIEDDDNGDETSEDDIDDDEDEDDPEDEDE